VSCRAERTFNRSRHTCSCQAETGHETAHDCRCGRSWWNTGPEPASEPLAQVDGHAYVEGKGYVPHGKAQAYAALGLSVVWGTHQAGPDKDKRILQYKDND
jgi:hypothetical protein